MGMLRADSSEVHLCDADVIWALRGISSMIWTTCEQLRELLCHFHRPVSRQEVLCMLLLRTIDWPVNGKMCQAKFTKDSWAILKHRIGTIVLFPYVQPENETFQLNLSVYEHRL